MPMTIRKRMAVDVDVCPHGAVVGHLERDGLVLDDGVAAEDHHVVVSLDHVGEVLFVVLGVDLVAAVVVVLLDAEDVHLLTAHLGEDVLGDEACRLASEVGYVVGGHLDAGLAVGILRC